MILRSLHLFALFLALAADTYSLRADGTDPDLVVGNCVTRNNGERRIGVFMPAEIGGRLSLGGGPCFPGSSILGTWTATATWTSSSNGIFLGHGDGLFGIMTTAFVDQRSGVALASGDVNGDGYDGCPPSGLLALGSTMAAPKGRFTAGSVSFGTSPGGASTSTWSTSTPTGSWTSWGNTRRDPWSRMGREEGSSSGTNSLIYASTRAIADVNGDGLLDIVSAYKVYDDRDPNFGRLIFYLYLGAGLGKLSERKDLLVMCRPRPVG